MYIPNSIELRTIIMDEIHKRLYSSHIGYQKMIVIARKQYFWLGMKNGIVKYIPRCIEC